MDITPTPTDEEAAAIAAAIEVSWPRTVAGPTSAEPPPRWRFAGRWWTNRSWSAATAPGSRRRER